ncbi:hypothetical protein [Verrucosispora sp. TAA-831]|uniref:hypothetical protein n=1 Tax=Verrucosispora sp. TAA-831 TaxID=3422227 RepID=UPI003D6E7C54
MDAFDRAVAETFGGEHLDVELPQGVQRAAGVVLTPQRHAHQVDDMLRGAQQRVGGGD